MTAIIEPLRLEAPLEQVFLSLTDRPAPVWLDSARRIRVAPERRRVAYVPQRESVDWDFPVSALDVVAMGLYRRLGWCLPVRRKERELARQKEAEEKAAEEQKRREEKAAQEAHEAIRPTVAARDPESIRQYLEQDQYNLYKLIWNRFIASQMVPAILDVYPDMNWYSA